MTTPFPAVVTIPDLPLATTLSTAALFEAMQTTSGVGESVSVSLPQLASTIFSTFLNGTAGLPIVANGSNVPPSAQPLSLSSANLTGFLTVVNGGIGTTALASHGVVLGNGTSALAVAVPTTTGWPLLSNNATSDPSFAQLGTAALLNGVTGTGAFVLANSPSLTAPDLGVAVATSINGVTLNTNAWSTYTPTISSQVGTITSSSASGRYKSLGKTVFFELDVSITTAGTGAGWLGASLPATTAAANYAATGFQVNSGNLVAAFFGSSGSTTVAHIVRYDATTIIANGSQVVITGVYETS